MLWNTISEKIKSVVARLVDWHILNTYHKYLFRDQYLFNRVYFYFGFRVIPKEDGKLKSAKSGEGFSKGLRPAAYLSVTGSVLPVAQQDDKAKGGDV